jgi:ketosteroid isomerase-like protein
MRRLALALHILSLGCAPVLAAPSQGPAAAATAQAAPAGADAAAAALVRALEVTRLERLVAGDYDGLADLLADDLVYTHSNARVDTKESYLAPLRAGTTRYVEYDPSELTVRVHGTTAILVGRAQMRALVSGEERRNDLRFTNVWLFRDGRWRMVAWQSTRLP